MMHVERLPRANRFPRSHVHNRKRHGARMDPKHTPRHINFFFWTGGETGGKSIRIHRWLFERAAESVFCEQAPSVDRFPSRNLFKIPCAEFFTLLSRTVFAAISRKEEQLVLFSTKVEFSPLPRIVQSAERYPGTGNG